MTVTITAGDAPVIPPGYTKEEVAQCKALTEQIVGSLQAVKGHVAMSAVLTTYHHMVDGYGPDARFRAGQHLITVGAAIANAAIDAGAMHHAAEKNATAIAQQISNVIATECHGQVLDALLIVFQVLAQKYPCCTQIAADSAARVAQQLATAAAMTAAPASNHVH